MVPQRLSYWVCEVFFFGLRVTMLDRQGNRGRGKTPGRGGSE